MILTENSKLRGKHALFSPSQPSWLNYTNDEFASKLPNKYKSDIGSEIHEWASAQIELGHKITSVKEIQKDVETHIYEKYSRFSYEQLMTSITGDAVDSGPTLPYLSDYGKILLRCMKYVGSEAYETVKCYVNDCVGYKMRTEVLVDYTDNFFGTADALKFDGKVLRIHDLKTGSSPVHIEQLMIYAALYFLKLGIKKNEELDSITTELRIYQNNDILIAKPESEDLTPIMNKIVVFDRIMDKFKGGK